MKTVVVNISDIKLCNERNSMIITYALGSCIAVVLYDPVRKIGGMIHYLLPLSRISPDRAKQVPAMFADTGIPILFESMYKQGCKKENLIVKVAGGGKLLNDRGTFDIGKRNYMALRKIFWKNGVVVAAEDVGGNKSRTVKLILDTGKTIIRSQGEEEEL